MEVTRIFPYISYLCHNPSNTEGGEEETGEFPSLKTLPVLTGFCFLSLG